MFCNLSFSKIEEVDKIVAVVGDDIILESDVRNFSTFIKCNRDIIVNNSFIYDLIDDYDLIDLLMVYSAILQISVKYNFCIYDDELVNIFKKIAYINGISVEQLKNKLLYYGINYDQYCIQLRNNLIVSNFYKNEILNKIDLSVDESNCTLNKVVSEFYDNRLFNITYIFIPFSECSLGEELYILMEICDFFVKMHNNSNLYKLSFLYSFISQKNFFYNSSQWVKFKDFSYEFKKYFKNAPKGSVQGPLFINSGICIFFINNFCDIYKESDSKIYLKHILLREYKNVDKYDVYHNIKSILQQIKNNDITFSKAAKYFSEDYISSNQGGKLGWKNLYYFDNRLKKLFLSMNKDSISPPIHSKEGWHLFQLIDIKEVDKTNIFLRNFAKKLIFNDKFIDNVKCWLEKKKCIMYKKRY